MNAVDLLVLVALVAFGVRGYRKGMVRESIEIVAAVGGLLVAYRTAAAAGAWASTHSGIPVSVTAPVLFVLIAIVIASFGYGLAGGIHRVVGRRILWRRADGSLGIVLGTVKGLLICGITLVLLAQLSVPMMTSALENSWAGRAMYRVMPEFYRTIDGWLERSG